MPHFTPRSGNSVTNFNAPPHLLALSNLVVAPPSNVVVILRAIDVDTNTLTYSVDAAPAGYQLLGSTVFRWVVTTNQPEGTYPVSVRVTDNGIPPRSDTATFTITVARPGSIPTNVVAPPVINPGPVIQIIANNGGQSTFTIGTRPGHTYRVYYKDDLATAGWTRLGPDFVAANGTASLTDSFTAPKRFYWVLQVD